MFFTKNKLNGTILVYSGLKWSKVGDYMFMGEYHHTNDEKGRLTLPSKIREELGSDFIVTRGLDNCLFVYPACEWANIIEKYKTLPNTRDARNFMRFFLSGATEVNFDKQGRINIPTTLITYASLNRDCIIIGVNDHLEIWSSESWNSFVSSNEEHFSEIADNLFMNNVNL